LIIAGECCRADFLCEENWGKGSLSIYWLLNGVNPIRRRISSLIRRFSSSFFAIIHSSFSLNTSSSRVGFGFWTALVVPEAKVVVNRLSPTTEI
jgi:hypothetical protein